MSGDQTTGVTTNLQQEDQYMKDVSFTAADIDAGGSGANRFNELMLLADRTSHLPVSPADCGNTAYFRLLLNGRPDVRLIVTDSSLSGQAASRLNARLKKGFRAAV
jgi:hypothetical protein